MIAIRTAKHGLIKGRVLLALMLFLPALAVSAFAGSVVQTQLNLAAIAHLGAPITAMVRLTTSVQDLASFGPVMACIAAAPMVTVMVSACLAPAITGKRAPPLVLAVVGMLGMTVTFKIMGLITPMPNLVAAVRGTTGLLLMSLTGALGGAVYGWLLYRLQLSKQEV